MPAALTAEEAAEVVRLYQDLGQAVQTGIEREQSSTRELVDMLEAPTMVLQRPADKVVTTSYYWPLGEAVPHVQAIQPTLDRVRLIITFDCLYPICFSPAIFNTDNAVAAGGTSGRRPWHGTSMVAPTWYGQDAVGFFGSGQLVLNMRGPLFIAPAPLFVINNSGDCNISVTQEIINPPAPAGSPRPMKGRHTRGCGCGDC